MWTNKPTSDGGRCSLRGVLKITPPKWAQSVSYHMAFEKSTRYSFNIGDSLTNNAWGKSNKQHSLSVIHINGFFPFYYHELRDIYEFLIPPFPYMGSGHRFFNLHVLRCCAYCIFGPFSFTSSVHLSFGLPVFRIPPTYIFLGLTNISPSVFLHMASPSQSYFMFSLMFATTTFVLISSQLIASIIPPPHHPSLFFLSSFAQTFSVPMYQFHSLGRVWRRSYILLLCPVST